jgi:hypothetical protein
MIETLKREGHGVSTDNPIDWRSTNGDAFLSTEALIRLDRPPSSSMQRQGQNLMCVIDIYPTHMMHSTTLSLLHCTHLKTCFRPVFFFFVIFLLACWSVVVL